MPWTGLKSLAVKWPEHRACKWGRNFRRLYGSVRNTRGIRRVFFLAKVLLNFQPFLKRQGPEKRGLRVFGSASAAELRGAEGVLVSGASPLAGGFNLVIAGF